MVQLGDGTKKVLLTGKNANKTSEYQPHFLNDSENRVSSSKEIYFLWLSRLVILCAVVSLGFFLSSTLVIFRLAPEIMVEPLILVANQKDSSSMVRYEPIAENMPSIKQLTEMYVRQYVIMRNTVVNDEKEMTTRWGPGGIVNYLSTDDVYMNFVGANIKHINKMFDKDFSSEVYIDSVTREENSPAWLVVFTVYNLSKGRNETGALTLKILRYKASVTPRFFAHRRLMKTRLINPLGFTVVKYNQSEIRE